MIIQRAILFYNLGFNEIYGKTHEQCIIDARSSISEVKPYTWYACSHQLLMYMAKIICIFIVWKSGEIKKKKKKGEGRKIETNIYI